MRFPFLILVLFFLGCGHPDSGSWVPGDFEVSLTSETEEELCPFSVGVTDANKVDKQTQSNGGILYWDDIVLDNKLFPVEADPYAQYLEPSGYYNIWTQSFEDEWDFTYEGEPKTRIWSIVLEVRDLDGNVLSYVQLDDGWEVGKRDTDHSMAWKTEFAVLYPFPYDELVDQAKGFLISQDFDGCVQETEVKIYGQS